MLAILNHITASMTSAADRRADDYRVLRKGMAYCWSVAVAAYPEPGKVEMAAWFDSDDEDVRWVMRQNLRKKRLARMDAAWVEAATARVAQASSQARR